MSANVVYSFSGYCRYDHIYNVLFNFHKVEDTKPYRSAKCSLHELEDFLKELQFVILNWLFFIWYRQLHNWVRVGYTCYGRDLSNFGSYILVLCSWCSYDDVLKRQNGAFTYTIQSLYDKASQTRISNAYYNGSSLGGCTVDAIDVFGSFSTYEAVFEVSRKAKTVE